MNNKLYIGQSIEETGRWKQHKYFASKNPVQYIHRAMAKYGVNNFIFETIAMCKTQEDADVTETLLIQQYNSRNKGKGYNVAPGGDSSWNKISDDKVSQLLLEYNKCKDTEIVSRLIGIDRSTVIRYLKSNGITAPKYSEARSRKIAAALTSKKLSSEHKEKLSAAKKGKPSPKKGISTGLPAWNTGMKKEYTAELLVQIQQLSALGISQNKIAKQLKLAKSTVRAFQKVA